MRNKHEGISANRLRREPTERAFAEAWRKHNEMGRTLDHLLYSTGTGRPLESSDRERVVAATVIQWLGSPVGQAFLRDLGYERSKP